MEPARSIGRLGFKRWYERQLIESHAWLITCFLCGLGGVAMFEGFSFRGPALPAMIKLGFMFCAAVISWYGLKRYGAIMKEAERLSYRSSCPTCKTYAAFNVIGEYPKLSVRCRKCSNEWVLG